MTLRKSNGQSKSLSVETLESRQLMTATLSSSGVWSIVGTNASDEIYVARDEHDPSVLLVEVNGRIVGEEHASNVRHIRIQGLRGHDFIEIDESAGAIRTPTTIYGQNGDDVILGGSGVDRIFGGAGHDELLGNDGNDFIYGGNGDDYLEGGRGNDLLNGGSGWNELVDRPDSPANPVNPNPVNPNPVNPNPVNPNPVNPNPVNPNPVNPNPVNQTRGRVPAEWERHDSTWMQWPKGEEVSYRDNFAGIIRTLQAYEQVNLVVANNSELRGAQQFLQSRAVPLQNIQFHIMPYDWSWMRDNGAIWVEKTDASGKQEFVAQDWGFDGWGGDGGPSRRDDAVPCQVASIEGVTCEKVDVVLEKGTLEFNGKDTVITSWTVLHDRNPNMTRGQLENVLREKFGVSKVVWLEGSSDSDLTDGHVDGIARFVNENTVVVGRYLDQQDPDAALFEDAARKIQAAGFNVVRLDIPGYVRYRGEWLPANYTNYLVANGVVIASSYGNAEFDNNARRQLQQLFPGRDIKLTDTRELWFNGGAVHCVTNDQPA
ncbi:MAG: agmatine deiminase family protein [Pirellulaceae bacterium]